MEYLFLDTLLNLNFMNIVWEPFVVANLFFHLYLPLNSEPRLVAILCNLYFPLSGEPRRLAILF